MLIIHDDILSAANMTAPQLKQEIAVYLYAKNKLSFRQACKLAEKDVLEFQELLYKNDVPIHYGISDLEEDFHSIHSS